MKPADALEAVLLFHGGGVWDSDKATRWVRLTGTPDATPKALCDCVRAALGQPVDADRDGAADRVITRLMRLGAT